MCEPAEIETDIYELQTFADPEPVTHLTIKHCSACGSSAPHHLDYVREHGICVV